MLTLTNLNAGYNQIGVLYDINMTVNQGEAVTVIGINGSGKTTLMNTISGLIKQTGGAIDFQGQDISSLSADRRVGLGIVQVPEGRQIFSPLTVLENLYLGMYAKYRHYNAQNKNDLLDYAYNLFPVLHERRAQKAGTLSGGEQQMLAIARSLMSQPKLLLLDEPSLGLAPLVVEKIFTVLKELNQAGLTVLLVEQNAEMALDVAQRGYVMDVGSIVLEGTTAELKGNRRVKEIYLGEAE
ncbi:MAG: ABC transporter ATP-binding protein [Firmicutes bacterium]|nr:ABC transporter ATP-binding protein [Bacillota bacterium]